MAIPHRVRIHSSRCVFPAAMLVFFALAMSVPAPAQSSRAGTGDVIAMRELQLKAGVDPNQFEQFVIGTYNPALEGAVPGMKGYIAKGDRGVRRGGYALILIFDSEKTRNAIYPKAGAGASEKFAPFLQRPLALTQELDKYVEPGSVSAYTDYVVMR